MVTSTSPFKFYFTVADMELKSDLSSLPSTNFMVSAWSLHRSSSMVRLIKRRREELNSLFIDSGMLSAWKSGKSSWAHSDYQLYIASKVRRIKPDVVTHLDLPMEPKFLEQNKVTRKEALRNTINNAEEFLNVDINKSKKCFVVQGWTLREYEKCIKQYQDMSIFTPEYWVGIGTTCMRRPPELYKVYKFCLDRILQINPEQHIHAFGIAKPEWLSYLYNLGVSSGDSASIAFSTITNKIILPTGKEVHLNIRPLPGKVRQHLFIVNAWSYHYRLTQLIKNNGEYTQDLKAYFHGDV